jgi:hypothetical protein
MSASESSHNAKSWLTKNSQLSIKVAMLTKECQQIQRNVFQEYLNKPNRLLRQQNYSPVSYSNIKAPNSTEIKNENPRTNNKHISASKKKSKSTMWSRKRIFISNYLSKGELVKRVSGLRNKCSAVENSLAKIEDIGNKETSFQDPCLLQKEKAQCRVALEDYERRYGLLTKVLLQESILLEDEQLQLERKIVGVFDSIEEF